MAKPSPQNHNKIHPVLFTLILLAVIALVSTFIRNHHWHKDYYTAPVEQPKELTSEQILEKVDRKLQYMLQAESAKTADFNARLDGAYQVAVDGGYYDQYFSTTEQFENELLPAAEAGNVKAETVVGELYHLGYLIEQNTTQALYWLEKAAAHGDLTASGILGNMYCNGDAVKQDYQQAIYWYRKPAENGNAIIQCLIGGIYFNGLGNVKKDNKEAFKWLKLSADQGNADAQALLSGMYFHGWGVEKNFQQARQLSLLAAAQGYEIAAMNLGVIYEKGLGVEIDIPLAIKYYRQSAAQGNDLSQARLKKLTALNPDP